MARINIESEIFRDKRFIKLTILTGSLETALGALTFAWIVGQDFWRYSDNGIPKSEWDRQDLNYHIVSCGLAEDLGDFIKIRGSEKHFGWIRSKVENGKKGGVAKSLNNSPSTAKQSLEVAKPLTLSLTLKELNTCRVPSKHMSFDFEIPYKQYPKRDGDQAKGKAIKKLKSKITTIEEFERFTTAVKNYASYVRKKGWENTEHVKMFFTFVNSDWTEWLEMKINGPKLITWEEEYGA